MFERDKSVFFFFWEAQLVDATEEVSVIPPLRGTKFHV